MANSTITLQSVVTYTKSFPDISAVVQTSAGGSALQPALTIASDVMTEMVAQPFNWKWNRFKLPVFYTNSWQQDYALNVVNLGWLEHGVVIDINNTATPLPQQTLEVVKDLEMTSNQSGWPGQVCWLPNDQLQYSTWPGAATTIATPLGATSQPANPILQIQDSNGNYWVVTTYGVTGSVEPTWPATVDLLYPTQADPTATATTVDDGTVVWTAINPKGQGIRCNPIPSQTGTVWQFNLIGQYRPFAFSLGPFTSLSQTIEPIPDDFKKYFTDGFVAMCYAHAPETKTRGKFADMYKMWKESIMAARVAGDRERTNAGFYPSQGIMSPSPLGMYVGPAYPFGQGW